MHSESGDAVGGLVNEKPLVLEPAIGERCFKVSDSHDKVVNELNGDL